MVCFLPLGTKFLVRNLLEPQEPTATMRLRAQLLSSSIKLPFHADGSARERMKLILGDREWVKGAKGMTLTYLEA
jgi:hypothetical protein